MYGCLPPVSQQELKKEGEKKIESSWNRCWKEKMQGSAKR